MRAGYAQMRPQLLEAKANLERMLQTVRDNPEADLLVFPELAVTGYAFTDRDEAATVAEPVPDGPSVKALEEVARECGTAIVSGFCEQDGDTLYNTAVVIGREGYVGKYRKCHLFWDEFDIFGVGDRFDVFDLDMGDAGTVRLGVVICFDWTFPEAWRTLALKGAQLVCCPSNLVLPGLAQSAIPIHSLINRYYSILANRTGDEKDLHFTGMSLVSGTKGEILVKASADGDEVGLADIDPKLAMDKMATPRNHVLEDRRPDIYFV